MRTRQRERDRERENESKGASKVLKNVIYFQSTLHGNTVHEYATNGCIMLHFFLSEIVMQYLQFVFIFVVISIIVVLKFFSIIFSFEFVSRFSFYVFPFLKFFFPFSKAMQCVAYVHL